MSETNKEKRRRHRIVHDDRALALYPRVAPKDAMILLRMMEDDNRQGSDDGGGDQRGTYLHKAVPRTDIVTKRIKTLELKNTKKDDRNNNGSSSWTLHPAVGGLSMLEELYLTNCKNVPSELSSCTALRVLQMDGPFGDGDDDCHITGETLQPVALPSLLSLKVCFTERSMRHFGRWMSQCNFPYLQVLDFPLFCFHLIDCARHWMGGRSNVLWHRTLARGSA